MPSTSRFGSLTLPLFLLLLSVGASPSSAGDPNCPGFSKAVLLRSEPVQVNPGAHCRLQMLFRLEITQPWETPPKFCVFARRAGHNDRLGPICSQGGTIGLPTDTEYMWTDGKPIGTIVKLTPKGQR